MKNQNVTTVTEVKQLDCDKLASKLKNQLIFKLSMNEEESKSQAEWIANIFRSAQLN